MSSRGSVVSAVNGTAAKTHAEQLSLRNRRLPTIDRLQGGNYNLRRLFRLIDHDHDTKVTHAEFQRGLVELGIKEAEDTSAVSKFLREVDVSRSGFIGEREFIQYFQRLELNDIRARLSEFQGKATVRVRAIHYGTAKKDFWVYELTETDIARFDEWLDQLNTQDWRADEHKRLWLDISGYEPAVMQAIARQYRFHGEMVKDAAIFQAPKVEAVPCNDPAPTHSQAEQDMELLAATTLPVQSVAEAATKPTGSRLGGSKGNMEQPRHSQQSPVADDPVEVANPAYVYTTQSMPSAAQHHLHRSSASGAAFTETGQSRSQPMAVTTSALGRVAEVTTTREAYPVSSQSGPPSEVGPIITVQSPRQGQGTSPRQRRRRGSTELDSDLEGRSSPGRYQDSTDMYSRDGRGHGADGGDGDYEDADEDEDEGMVPSLNHTPRGGRDESKQSPGGIVLETGTTVARGAGAGAESSPPPGTPQSYTDPAEVSGRGGYVSTAANELYIGSPSIANGSSDYRAITVTGGEFASRGSTVPLLAQAQSAPPLDTSLGSGPPQSVHSLPAHVRAALASPKTNLRGQILVHAMHYKTGTVPLVYSSGAPYTLGSHTSPAMDKGVGGHGHSEEAGGGPRHTRKLPHARGRMPGADSSASLPVHPPPKRSRPWFMCCACRRRRNGQIQCRCHAPCSHKASSHIAAQAVAAPVHCGQECCKIFIDCFTCGGAEDRDVGVRSGSVSLRLRNQKAVEKSPPDLVYEQVSLLVVDDNTIITVRGADNELDLEQEVKLTKTPHARRLTRRNARLFRQRVVEYRNRMREAEARQAARDGDHASAPTEVASSRSDPGSIRRQGTTRPMLQRALSFVERDYDVAACAERADTALPWPQVERAVSDVSSSQPKTPVAFGGADAAGEARLPTKWKRSITRSLLGSREHSTERQDSGARGRGSGNKHESGALMKVTQPSVEVGEVTIPIKGQANAILRSNSARDSEIRRQLQPDDVQRGQTMHGVLDLRKKAARPTAQHASDARPPPHAPASAVPPLPPGGRAVRVVRQPELKIKAMSGGAGKRSKDPLALVLAGSDSTGNLRGRADSQLTSSVMELPQRRGSGVIDESGGQSKQPTQATIAALNLKPFAGPLTRPKSTGALHRSHSDAYIYRKPIMKLGGWLRRRAASVTSRQPSDGDNEDNEDDTTTQAADGETSNGSDDNGDNDEDSSSTSSSDDCSDMDAEGVADPRPLGSVQRLFDQMVERLANYSVLSHLHYASVKELAFELTDGVLQRNYELRDALKDWEEVLETSIKHQVLPHQTAHVFSLAKTSELYARSLRPLLERLDPKNMGGTNRALFFKDQEVLFRELHDDMSTMMSDMQGIIDNADSLKKLYQTLQADKMNRDLYTLTVVTSVAVPAQFLTGVFGMNFEHMPELTYKWSYLFFWVAIVVISWITLWQFKRFRYFSPTR